jgi:DNA-binding LacI/PurR family transcriptional regulator
MVKIQKPQKIQMQSASSVPAQLRSILTGEISAGRYGESGRLPSERALAERFGVSRTSVRESLNVMVKDGALVRVVGKGTYVSSAAGSVPNLTAGPAGDKHLAFLIGENIFQFVQPGYSRILVGAEQTCRQKGYRLLFHSVGEEENDPQLGLPQGQPNGIRGCLVAGGLRKKSLERLLDWDVPIVLTDLIVQDGNTSAVGADYGIGTTQAIEYLASLGHTAIGFIGFPNSEKYRTYWRTLESLGLAYNPHLVQFLQLPDVEPGILSGFRAMQEMLASGSRPSAVIATNDLVAMGLMEALKMADIRVPAQMSVIGCDDLGRDMNPPLTTIRSYPEEVGRIAAKMLIDQLSGTSTPATIAVPTELVVRGTTAAPASTTGGFH